MTNSNFDRLSSLQEFPYSKSSMNSSHSHIPPTNMAPQQPFSLDGIEIEKSEPIVRLLAHIRKGGMDILFPQISHDKMLACIYVAITTTYTAAHRELLDLVMAVKDSGCINHVEHVSKTKIRGMLALLKHDDLLVTQSMEGQPARLCFSPDIRSFRDLRMRHDRFLERYMMEHHLFIPAFLKSELVWQIDEATYLQRMEGINALMKNVTEFYAGYLGIPVSASAHIPVRQILSANRQLGMKVPEEINYFGYERERERSFAPENHFHHPKLDSAAFHNNDNDHLSTTSSCTTLSDNTFGNNDKETGDIDHLMQSAYVNNSNKTESLSEIEQNRNTSPPRQQANSMDWYAMGRQTSNTARVNTMASLQQQALNSHYLNRSAATVSSYSVPNHPPNYGGANYGDEGEYASYHAAPRRDGYADNNYSAYPNSYANNHGMNRALPPSNNMGNRPNYPQANSYAPQGRPSHGYADMNMKMMSTNDYARNGPSYGNNNYPRDNRDYGVQQFQTVQTGNVRYGQNNMNMQAPYQRDYYPAANRNGQDPRGTWHNQYSATTSRYPPQAPQQQGYNSQQQAPRMTGGNYSRYPGSNNAPMNYQQEPAREEIYANNMSWPPQQVPSGQYRSQAAPMQTMNASRAVGSSRMPFAMDDMLQSLPGISSGADIRGFSTQKLSSSPQSFESSHYDAPFLNDNRVSSRNAGEQYLFEQGLFDNLPVTSSNSLLYSIADRNNFGDDTPAASTIATNTSTSSPVMTGNATTTMTIHNVLSSSIATLSSSPSSTSSTSLWDNILDPTQPHSTAYLMNKSR